MSLSERRSTTLRRMGPFDRRLMPGAVYVIDEARFTAICHEALYAKFRGVQLGHGAVEGVVLFEDIRQPIPDIHGLHDVLQQSRQLPTLALPISKFSISTVTAKLSESLEKWRVK